jgi:hypothetical protein
MGEIAIFESTPFIWTSVGPVYLKCVKTMSYVCIIHRLWDDRYTKCYERVERVLGECEAAWRGGRARRQCQISTLSMQTGMHIHVRIHESCS